MPKEGTYNYTPATVDSLNAEEASNLKVNDVSHWDCLNASPMQHLSEHTRIRIIEILLFFRKKFDCKSELHDITQFCKHVVFC